MTTRTATPSRRAPPPSLGGLAAIALLLVTAPGCYASHGPDAPPTPTPDAGPATGCGPGRIVLDVRTDLTRDEVRTFAFEIDDRALSERRYMAGDDGLAGIRLVGLDCVRFGDHTVGVRALDADGALVAHATVLVRVGPEEPEVFVTIVLTR